MEAKENAVPNNWSKLGKEDNDWLNRQTLNRIRSLEAQKQVPPNTGSHCPEPYF